MDQDQLLAEAQALVDHLTDLARRWECDRPDCDGLPHAGWLHHHARLSQREPDRYRTWLFMAGRGTGKTRTGAETVRKWTRDSARHVAIIARTDREVRNICFDGPAGLVRVLGDDVAVYNRSPGDSRLVLRNGSVLRAFSAENPDALRGYAFDGAWVDEYGAWAPVTAQDVMDNLWFALREAADPRVIVTTTPRRVPHVRDLLAAAATDQRIVVTRGRTTDNLPNLGADAVAELVRRYGGTRLGRQELDGELIEDVEGALWTWSMIRYAAAVPEFHRVVVAIDPAVTSEKKSDETGIVAAGVSGDPRWPQVTVLADVSGRWSVQQWADQALLLATQLGADSIVAEVNNGGDLVERVLRQQGMPFAYRSVRASRGKWTRAEPVAMLYEQGRVEHACPLTELEEQMTCFTGQPDGADDRVDALVWAVTDLAITRPLQPVRSFAS